MQDRLGNLNGNVDDIRQRIPENLDGKLENIETGLDNLNQRVSEIWSSESERAEIVPANEGIDENLHDKAGFSDVDTPLADADFDVTAADEAVAAEPLATSDDEVAFSEFEQDTLEEQAAQVEDVHPAALKSAAAEEIARLARHPEATSSHLMQGIDTFEYGGYQSSRRSGFSVGPRFCRRR